MHSITEILESLERLPALAAKTACYLEISDNEETPTEYYDRLIQQLAVITWQITALRNHRHRWNENGYCTICGQDGAA